MLIDFYRYLLHFLPVILLALPALYWVYRNATTPRQWKIGMAVVAGIGIVSSAILLASQIPQAPRHDWSACRLASAVTWMGGYRLYYPIDQGPVLMQMYGPVSAMLYTPAALASRPTPAILIATFINFAVYILPVVWFLRRSARGTPWVYTLCAVALFLVIGVIRFVLFEAATRITIDAPAVGLATCAMAVVVGNRIDHPWRRGALCGIFVALSIWTKLTLAPIAIVVPLYVLLLVGRRDAIRFTVAMSIVIVALTGVFIGWFGPAMLQQTIDVPLRQPWQWPALSRAAAYMRAAGWIWYFSRVVVWITVLAILLRFEPPGRERGAMKRFAFENPWLLPLLASICVVPTATLAYVKIGGSWNNAVAPAYFALLAATSAFGAACAESDSAVAVSRRCRIARLTLATLIFALCAIGWRSPAVVLDGLKVWGDLNNNPQEVAYRYAKKHPGEIYFPNQPLSSFLAERRVYHLNAGLDSMAWAGHSLTDERLREFFPPHMKAVAFIGGAGNNLTNRWPGFEQVVEVSDLPGWELHTRDGRAP